MEIDAVPQRRRGAGSGRPVRFVIDGGTVLGVVLLLVMAFGAYKLLAPAVFENPKVERAVSSAHREFTDVSCTRVQFNPREGSSYTCVAHSSLGVRCVDVVGSSMIHVSRPTSRPGKRPSC